jgi:GMP synthase (glutamine-hydrolysing)
MQTMAMQLGGHVEASNEREFGYAQVEVVNDSALVRGIEDALTADGKPLLDVWMSHGDKVTAIRLHHRSQHRKLPVCHYG